MGQPNPNYYFLIKKYHYLILKIVSRFSNNHCERCALIEAGYHGLLRGISRYQLSDGEFVVFIIPFIINAIHHSYERQIRKTLVDGTPDIKILEELVHNKELTKESVVSLLVKDAYYDK